MTTLTEFYALLSREIRRGTTFDADIPGRVALAVRWMEMQHTFLHMERYNPTVAIGQGVSAIAVPAGFKSMNFWRLIKPSVGSTGTRYRFLTKIDAKDSGLQNTAMPSAYVQNGKIEFVLDAISDQAYNSNMSYIGYSVLPTDPSEEPQVLQDYQEVIFHQSCVLLSTLMRDGSFGSAHKGLRDEAMSPAVDADVEERQSNESPSVQYGHEFVEEINDRGESAI